MMMTWTQYVSSYYVNVSHMLHYSAIYEPKHASVDVCDDPWPIRAWWMTHTLPRVQSNVHDQDHYSWYSTIVVGVYVHRLHHVNVATLLLFINGEKRDREWYNHYIVFVKEYLRYGNIPLTVERILTFLHRSHSTLWERVKIVYCMRKYFLWQIIYKETQ